MRAAGLLRRLLGAAILAAPLALSGQSELSTGAAATADPLLVLGQGARPLAMGSAFTAVKGDLMAALFNPAGQAYLRGAQASAHHHAWLGGINQDSLAAVLAGEALSVGLYGDLVNYGEVQGYDADGNETGGFTPMDFTLGLALAHQWRNGLAIGATVRGTQQNFKENGQLLNSGDLGAMWAAREMPVTLGIAFANLGPAVNGSSPTTALRLGLSWDQPVTGRSSVLFAVGGSGLNNGSSLIQMGAEGSLNHVFFVRLGYQLSFLDNKTGGLSGLSSGLGAKLGPLVLDYAYLPYGRLGNSHRVSASFEFDNGKPMPKPPAALPAPAAAPAAVVPVKASAPAPAQAPAAAAPPVQPGSVDMVFEIPDDAGDSLRRAVEERPKDAEAWKALGRYYFGKKDKARMLEAFDRALELDPSDQALRDWRRSLR